MAGQRLTAKVFPDGWRELAATGAAERELQTLARLAEGLPDSYTIYHGVHWTRVEHNNYAIFGEIDFAIVGPTGKLLLIEQKTGLLTETVDGLIKKYSGERKERPFPDGAHGGCAACPAASGLSGRGDVRRLSALLSGLHGQTGRARRASIRRGSSMRAGRIT